MHLICGRPRHAILFSRGYNVCLLSPLLFFRFGSTGPVYHISHSTIIETWHGWKRVLRRWWYGHFLYHPYLADWQRTVLEFRGCAWQGREGRRVHRDLFSPGACGCEIARGSIGRCHYFKENWKHISTWKHSSPALTNGDLNCQASRIWDNCLYRGPVFGRGRRIRVRFIVDENLLQLSTYEYEYVCITSYSA